MENIQQNLLAAQINYLCSLNNETTQETVDTQLRIIQMNCMIRKFYQDQQKLLQQLQQDQQKFLGDFASPSPPGSSIAGEQQQQQQAVEGPVDLPPEFSAEEADHREESMELQDNLLEVSILNEPGETSLGPAPMRAGDSSKVARGPAATRTKLCFHPDDFRQSANGPNIAALKLTKLVEVDLVYHENMIRSFGNKRKVCTPMQRERRMRNNQAARIFRAKARAICNMLEKEYTDAAETNDNRKVLVAQKRVYIARLLKLLGLPAKDLTVEWEQQKTTADDQEAEVNESDYGNGTTADDTCRWIVNRVD